jgi:arabinosyltransferase B
VCAAADVGCARAVGVAVAGVGVLAALALPFAPVIARQATVTWPVPGQPVSSTTALFVPYRPAELTVTVPCATLRAAAEAGHEVNVLATGPDGEGMVLRTGAAGTELALAHRRVGLRFVSAAVGCDVTVHAASDGVTVVGGGFDIALPGEPMPQVFAFHTGLDPVQADGITVVARTASPFATTPTMMKVALIAAQLCAVVLALIVLNFAGRRARRPAPPACRTPGGRAAAAVDLAVIAVLAGWAIIGPLAVDDGWAAMIARTYAATGSASNYYRWWNASETPFALSQQLLAPLTRISLAPLWLRLPSTALGVATWLVLSRGLLRAALPAAAARGRIRLLAAVCLLSAWLPFNLGARPESYVALGVTSVLALLWRARGPATLGWAALIAGLTIPISPTAVVVAAPVVVFAPKVIAIARQSTPGGLGPALQLSLLGCIAAVALTVIFADQTWDGLITATGWHRFFGPSMPWYQEAQRYRYLLGDGQQGSFGKRLPVLLTAALVPLIGLLWVRRAERSDSIRAAARLATVVSIALLLLSLVPSKWSYHLGALAGVFAAFLVVAVVALLGRAGQPVAAPGTGVLALAGGMAVALSAALAFAGSNAWWLPAIYDVWWASGPVRPLAVRLDSALPWIAVLALGYTVVAVMPTRRERAAAAVLLLGPALVTVLSAATAVAVMLVSFTAAPLRRPSGSLAMTNLRWLAGQSTCGLADDIEVLQDGGPLAPAGPTAQLAGFAPLTGYPPDSPPPDPPGSGMSTELWGSLIGGPQRSATMTSPWFRLPPPESGEGVSVSAAGNASTAPELIFEFGRVDSPQPLGDAAASTTTLGAFTRPVPTGENLDRSQWRSISIDAAHIPAGANLVRIWATDARTDPAGWLAFTGPRRNTVVGLTPFLAEHGPVLVSWPASFLFPCVRNVARVADGLAQNPHTVILAPGLWPPAEINQKIGGDFAALVPYGRLYEVSARLAGHPDIDWGTLLVSADSSAQDAYQLRISGVRRPGHGDRDRLYQVQLPR